LNALWTDLPFEQMGDKLTMIVVHRLSAVSGDKTPAHLTGGQYELQDRAAWEDGATRYQVSRKLAGGLWKKFACELF
jgi:hypothetical protein